MPHKSMTRVAPSPMAMAIKTWVSSRFMNRDVYPGGLYRYIEVQNLFANAKSCCAERNPQDFAFLEGFDLPEPLRATASRTSALKAASSTFSPSWMSIARRVFPSRLELKRRAGSFRDAPLAKVSFTTFL